MLAERFEEDNDPEAAFSEEDDFNSPSVTDHPRSDFSEGSKNINLNLRVISQPEFTTAMAATPTYDISNGDPIHQGLGIGETGEYSQMASSFGFGNNYGEFGAPQLSCHITSTKI